MIIGGMLMSDKDKIFENLLQEFKRGTLVFTVLLNVGKPSYGYSLIKKLQDCGINIEQNTLYPLLRRLEKQNLLTSYWDTSESRPRKYYEISEIGKEILEMITTEWNKTNSIIEGMILSGKEGN